MLDQDPGAGFGVGPMANPTVRTGKRGDSVNTLSAVWAEAKHVAMVVPLGEPTGLATG